MAVFHSLRTSAGTNKEHLARGFPAQKGKQVIMNECRLSRYRRWADMADNEYGVYLFSSAGEGGVKWPRQHKKQHTKSELLTMVAKMRKVRVHGTAEVERDGMS